MCCVNWKLMLPHMMLVDISINPLITETVSVWTTTNTFMYLSNDSVYKPQLILMVPMANRKYEF